MTFGGGSMHGFNKNERQREKDKHNLMWHTPTTNHKWHFYFSENSAMHQEPPIFSYWEFFAKKWFYCDKKWKKFSMSTKNLIWEFSLGVSGWVGQGPFENPCRSSDKVLEKSHTRFLYVRCLPLLVVTTRFPFPKDRTHTCPNEFLMSDISEITLLHAVIVSKIDISQNVLETQIDIMETIVTTL